MQSVSQVLTDTTSIKKENFISRFPETIEVKTCPKCGGESNVLEAWHPSKEEYFIVDFVGDYGHCMFCQNDIESLERIQKEQQEMKLRRIERIKKMFDTDSLINPKLKTATFENYHPITEELNKAKSIAKRYADNFSLENPVSLLLIGSYGTGKSHLSVSITKELMEKSLSCIFISTPKLMTKIRSTYNKESEYTEEQIIDQLSKVDCLVLDDIGAESIKLGDGNQHTWATSKIFEIIDNRIGKHTVFTSNYEPKELQERLGGRNFSRMMESVHVVKMYGDDYRLKAFK